MKNFKNKIFVLILLIILAVLGYALFKGGTNSKSVRDIPQEDGVTNIGRSIKLYYYNPSLDQGPGGAQCSRNGLVAVDRVIPQTQTPLRDSIALLLRGELTDEEKANGITTEYPLPEVTL